MLNHLKAVRKQHRFTAAMLADACGVASNTMLYWEKTSPSLRGIERLLLFYQSHGYPVKFTDLITLEITSDASVAEVG
ncbi:helix-turn-helix transcriptional regulator [uncultured Paraglaciecola sp.]|uniref:helix-turn-helix domain-containing protein n=1 Tax=uncultured Paraglaciecola sp. TaxID=1765024 RepID=UPI0026357128|nr:helix-turn-helix transcriptional regulator [uncultured Paraglaciecola sp.]